MAQDALAINTTEVFRGAFAALPPEVMERFLMILDILKFTSILFLLYLVFLIIRRIILFFVDIKSGHALTKIATQVEQINDKLDVLITHKTSMAKETKGQSTKETPTSRVQKQK